MKHHISYPNAQIQDFIKLIYQNEFGPGHMITNKEDCLKRLKEEYNSLPHKEETTALMVEEIGNGMVRLYLPSLPAALLPLVNEVFILSANHAIGTKESFEEKLKQFADDMIKNKLFSKEELAFYLKDYQANGYPAIHHSSQYRQSYHPAYRVIKKSLIPVLEVGLDIYRRSLSSSLVVVGIDGNCASGKSTLASMLGRCFDGNMITTDDFFLPPNLRTQQRLKETGGNLHYERFYDEVIQNIKSGNQLSYQKFSCKTMDFVSTITLTQKPVLIIEGSYCMRKEFQPVYDIKIGMQCEYETQINRIRERNGEEMLKNFQTKWIPMENQYFTQEKIFAQCDYILQSPLY